MMMNLCGSRLSTTSTTMMKLLSVLLFFFISTESTIAFSPTTSKSSITIPNKAHVSATRKHSLGFPLYNNINGDNENSDKTNTLVTTESKPVSKDDNDDGTWILEESNHEIKDLERRNLFINLLAGGLLAVTAVASWNLYQLQVDTPPGFARLPQTQFLAARGDPTATHGTDAQTWGLWRDDPGPRGVWLRNYQSQLVDRQYVAPLGWKLDPNDWWIEEHGLIMESPQFPVPPGRYWVTGGRQVTTGLTIDAQGGWHLDEGTLFDVTHLPCRSARYQPLGGTASSPANARLQDFPVQPGAIMPSIPGTRQQDYAVLFVIGKQQ